MGPMQASRGKFIVFEGIDGAGKSTQLRRLAEYLEGKGRRVYLTAEPTASVSGGLLRDALSGVVSRTECEMAVLFVLDRVFHNVNPVNGIQKMLSDGVDVLCDRYYYSSLAYQGSATDFEWVRAMNLNCPEILRPDVCLFLDLDTEESLRRIRASRETVEIYEKKEALERIRAQFMRVLTLPEEKDRVVCIDASADIGSVWEAVRTAVDAVVGE